MKQYFFFSALIAILMVNMACTMSSKITIHSDGRGSISSQLQIPEYILEQISLVTESIPNGANLLEPQSIAKDLADSPDIDLVKIQSPQKGLYHIHFQFQNLEESATQPSFLQWKTKQDGQTQVLLKINRKTYQNLENRFPKLKENLILKIYGPPVTEGIDRQSYLDMIAYSFGEKAVQALTSMKTNISIQVPGTISKYSGGTKISDKEVLFQLHPLDLIFMDKTKEYSVTYR